VAATITLSSLAGLVPAILDGDVAWWLFLKWSDINRRRWKELEGAGLLAAPGRAAAPTGNSYAPRPSIPELPAYVARAFKANLKAWQHFQALARTDRRDFVVWIHTARRPETRERRIRESIALLSAGRKLGLR
jgi:hypothetical protein